MMEHLIISSETDREAGREVRERKIVVEKRSVDEMILVYLRVCVCVCSVCLRSYKNAACDLEYK